MSLGSEVPPLLVRISWPALAVPWGGPSKKGNGANRTGGSTILTVEGVCPIYQGLGISNRTKGNSELALRAFRCVSRVVPDFALEALNRTRGTSNRMVTLRNFIRHRGVLAIFQVTAGSVFVSVWDGKRPPLQKSFKNPSLPLKPRRFSKTKKTDLLKPLSGLCWVGTASGPFLENNFHPP